MWEERKSRHAQGGMEKNKTKQIIIIIIIIDYVGLFGLMAYQPLIVI